MTENRTADSGILGFTYQFLQTAIQILEQVELDTILTVEGIEDLDISTANETELVQYKYHDAQQFTSSTIDKPIALMFKHFVENYKHNKENWNTKYTLFSYFGIKRDNEPDKDIVTIKDVKTLKKILKYSRATEILKNTTWEDEYLEPFFSNLEFTVANNFNDAQTKLLKILSTTFGVDETESKVFYFPKAIYYINQLATKKQIENRMITKQQFIDYLRDDSQIIESLILKRLFGEDDYIKSLKKYLSSKNIKPNTHSHVLHLFEITAFTDRIITDLAKLFVKSNAKRDIHPLTIIVHEDIQKITDLKKRLSELNVIEQQNLTFNDGYEDYYFNPHYFNAPPLIVPQRNGQKIEKASYNFKILSSNTYDLNREKITFENPYHFIFGNIAINQDNKGLISTSKLYVTNLNEQQIFSIFGG